MICVYVCLCVATCTRVQCLQKPQEGIVSPVADITGNRELPNMSLGN